MQFFNFLILFKMTTEFLEKINELFNYYPINKIQCIDRDDLNIPTKKEAEELVSKWYKYGYKLFSIYELKNENPNLHSDYLDIFKFSYFYYMGIDSGKTSIEFETHKYSTLFKVIEWAKKHYYEGNPKISDILYDSLKQNIHVRTIINPQSFSPKIKVDICEESCGCISSDPKDIWDECGEKFYTIKLLKEQRPYLHSVYIKLKKLSFLYINNARVENNFFGKNGFILYIKEKYDTIDKIVDWAKYRYYNGLPTFTDTEYDSIKQSRNVKNIQNTRSINPNNE